jgi:hypothetical protein
VGLRRSPRIALALELEVPHRWDRADPLLRPDLLHLEYGALRRGYAWVFPKADHLNIGAGLFYGRQRDLRRDPSARSRIMAAIGAYAAALGVDPARLRGLRVHGHPLPIWDGPEPLHSADGRVLLVGDAAGLINPLFGDGLFHAIRSGRLAAEALLAGQPCSHTARVHGLLADDFEAARRLAEQPVGSIRLAADDAQAVLPTQLSDTLLEDLSLSPRGLVQVLEWGEAIDPRLASKRPTLAIAPRSSAPLGVAPKPQGPEWIGVSRVGWEGFTLGNVDEHDNAYTAAVRKRFGDDTVFSNTHANEPELRKRFVNDLVRSDFHRAFLNVTVAVSFRQVFLTHGLARIGRLHHMPQFGGVPTRTCRVMLGGVRFLSVLNDFSIAPHSDVSLNKNQ